ncbi:hypothetical protein [Paenibacillus lutrae]|nr:hypothetical protein [Paenibacillus lutrae]
MWKNKEEVKAVEANKEQTEARMRFKEGDEFNRLNFDEENG